MIKTKELVPSIYYNKSRDFQAIGRVFEVLYNYAKTNVDLVLNSYEDVKMLDLLAKTIGFNSKHNYNTDDLITLCNTFITILRDKGSLQAVSKSVIALLNAQHIEGNFLIEDVTERIPGESGDEFVYIKKYLLNIYVPKELTDLILLEDLFDYILPVGYSYRFISAVFPQDSLKTGIAPKSAVNCIKYTTSNDISQVAIVTNTGSHAYNIDRPNIDTETAGPLGISYASVVFRPDIGPFTPGE